MYAVHYQRGSEGLVERFQGGGGAGGELTHLGKVGMRAIELVREREGGRDKGNEPDREMEKSIY